MILFRRRLNIFTRFVHVGRFGLVGTKFTQKVRYDRESCLEFDSILSSESPSSSAKENSDEVNRWFLGCLFSRIIGSNLPLSIYISQSVNYHKEVHRGEELLGQVQVVKDLGKKKYQLNTICRDSNGDLVMSGQAIILQE